MDECYISNNYLYVLYSSYYPGEKLWWFQKTTGKVNNGTSVMLCLFYVKQFFIRTHKSWANMPWIHILKNIICALLWQ